MPTAIDYVLSRRSDLSSFLVHLTRGSANGTAKEKLQAILQQQKLSAITPFGPAVPRLIAANLPTASQNCVCFTETPLEHVSLLLGEIDGRDCEFEPYGVAISKKQGRRNGANPVWYIDQTAGHDWIGAHHIEPMIDDAVATGTYDDKHIRFITPFIEQMGSGVTQAGVPWRKEFWWEREWRRVGDLPLPNHLIVFCPQEEILDFQAVVDAMQEAERHIEPRFIDPRWSLEKIIGRLAGFTTNELGPF